jgi:hypothetical protein
VFFSRLKLAGRQGAIGSLPHRRRALVRFDARLRPGLLAPPDLTVLVGGFDGSALPTLTFERLFAFLVLGHGRRQLLWFEVTRDIRRPSGLARQITEAFPWSSAPAYLVRDNDRAYGHVFTS